MVQRKPLSTSINIHVLALRLLDSAVVQELSQLRVVERFERDGVVLLWQRPREGLARHNSRWHLAAAARVNCRHGSIVAIACAGRQLGTARTVTKCTLVSGVAILQIVPGAIPMGTLICIVV